jgi:hypothetical protein
MNKSKKIDGFHLILLAIVLAAAGCGGGGASLPKPAILTVYNSNVDFGDVAVGNNSTVAVTFSNTGGSPLTLAQNSVSGTGFTTTGIGSGLTLAPGQYVALAVSFNPSSTGKANGMISLTSSTLTAPMNLSLAGNGVVASHWATFDWAPSRSAVVGYNVYLRSPSDVSWIKLNASPVTTNSYTDWDVQSGQSYMYSVTAVNSANVESAFSNATLATIPSP